MTRGLASILVIAVLFVAAPAANAQNYSEFAHTWLINARWPNWTCAPGVPALPGGCTPTSQAAGYAYVEAHLLRLGAEIGQPDKGHIYVSSFSNLQGPGGECWGDDILHFTTPWTHDGVRGIGVVYQGVIHPSAANCDPPADPQQGRYWGIGGAFWDSYLSKVVVTANKILWNEFGLPGGGFRKLFYGTSSNGHNFTWKSLVTASAQQVQFFGASLLPHPSINGLWFGGLAFSDNGATGTAFMEVDHVLNKVRIMTSTGWKEVAIGGTFTFVPLNFWPGPLFESGRAITHLADLGGGTYEAWASSVKPRTGITPCPGGTPTATYSINVNPNGAQADQQRASAGRGAGYRVITVVGQNYSAGPEFALSSTQPHPPVPTDYFTGSMAPTRFDVPGSWGPTVFTGSADGTVCDVDLDTWNYSAGVGVKFRAVAQ